MRNLRRLVGSIVLLVLWAGILSGFAGGLEAAQPGAATGSAQFSAALAQAPYSNIIYLPITLKNYPSFAPFGLETHSPFSNSDTLYRTQDLEAGYVRMGVRISWRTLQPEQGGPINWDLLAAVDNELRILRAANVRAGMVIADSPLWALKVITDDMGICNFGAGPEPCSIDTTNDGLGDGKSYCGQIASANFGDFAFFMSQLVARYSKPEFNVKIWEIGNEVDVDPQLVPGDSGYGCWGNLDDKAFYDGDYYGNMLKVVTPAIKAADPQAQVWIGGLLLSSPGSISSYFLKGILSVGAAPYFDAVPYHWYAWYDPNDATPDIRLDYDNLENSTWNNLGGGSWGKARYLTQMMAEYGVTKPLIMNEVALGCNPAWVLPGNCDLGADGIPVLSDGFLQAQADFIPRAAMRAMKGKVQQVYWFMLEENTWGYVGLLDIARVPKPVYYAYRNLIEQFQYGTFLGPVIYNNFVEAYEVQRSDGRRMHVVWKVTDGTIPISVPESALIEIYSRDGEIITKPAPSGGTYAISVGFSPIYLILTP